MRGTVLYGPGDVRFEDREDPRIIEPADAVIRMAATCVCGSDLWPYRGLQPVNGPTAMGHEYGGMVEEVGSGVRAAEFRAPIHRNTSKTGKIRLRILQQVDQVTPVADPAGLCPGIVKQRPAQGMRRHPLRLTFQGGQYRRRPFLYACSAEMQTDMIQINSAQQFG